MRCAGILMAVSALPSKYGIGDFGNSCYELIDFLAATGCKVWQILPLNPLGYGNSPYQPYSSVAMDELYISLDELKKDGLLNKVPSFRASAKKVDYEEVRKFKHQYVVEAFKNFKPNKDYKKFCEQKWVYEFAVFMTFKHLNEEKCWLEWDAKYQNWIKNRDSISLDEYQDAIELEMFIQYELRREWKKVKAYANKKRVRLVGDMPIYVGIDSLDVWSNQAAFLLDDKSHPTFIAGVPPDYFSATGQRWGNPLYDWEYLQQHNFDFWVERLRGNVDLFDMLRIDHFRAFDTYWKIPASCPTAIDGVWVEAPGYELFDTLNKELPNLNIIAEDLGDLREEVYVLRDHYNFPGMKIVQFTFDPSGNSYFKDRENMLAYTGTHDNDTIRGWYAIQKPYWKKKTRDFFKKNGYEYENIWENFIQYALDTICDYAIIPVQDILGLTSTGRINTPGTVGSPNWEWKLDSMKKLWEKEDFLKKAVKKSKR